MGFWPYLFIFGVPHDFPENHGVSQKWRHPEMAKHPFLDHFLDPFLTTFWTTSGPSLNLRPPYHGVSHKKWQKGPKVGPKSGPKSDLKWRKYHLSKSVFAKIFLEWNRQKSRFLAKKVIPLFGTLFLAKIRSQNPCDSLPRFWPKRDFPQKGGPKIGPKSGRNQKIDAITFDPHWF